MLPTLLDAAILRLRPVLITVGAPVITLLLVPVFYSVALLELKTIKWVPGEHA